MNRCRKIREALNGNTLLIAAMLRLPDPTGAELIARAGVDLIFIDNEHYPFNPETISAIVRAVHLADKACLIRVPNDDPHYIEQVLSYGVDGIKVPHVETREQGEKIVAAVQKRHQDSNPGNESIIAFMVETKTGLENMSDILSIPAVDLIAIGPSDVSASYGFPGNPNHPVVKAAIEKAFEQVIASDKQIIALANNREATAQQLKKGAKVILVGSDLQAYAYGFQSLIRDIHKNLEARLTTKEGQIDRK